MAGNEEPEPEAPFRQFIPDDTTPRFSRKFLAKANTYEWVQGRLKEDAFAKQWTDQWHERLAQPYKGITTDGRVQGDLYSLAEPLPESQAPDAVRKMVAAVEAFCAVLSPGQLQLVQHDIDAQEWRAWSNPELYVFQHGLRLEECSDEVVTAVHEVLKASLSPSGYAKVHGCMRVNHFLGSVVDGLGVLNENSYNISLFGEPSLAAPWGWQLTGHHLCLNCFVVGSQQIISPAFLGAEPNAVDEGPHRGLTLFDAQEAAGLKVMAVLDPELRERVQVYKDLKDSATPEWRFHRADQRHLGGAFQDNRIVPYEGALVTEFPPGAQAAVKEVVKLAFDLLPSHVLEQKLNEVAKHWRETYFCWIGGWQPTDAFYYKVHSPVTMVEFDHHSGVFLTNQEALPFHIHTLVRTPNGNDYGKELLRQYYERDLRG